MMSELEWHLWSRLQLKSLVLSTAEYLADLGKKKKLITVKIL